MKTFGLSAMATLFLFCSICQLCGGSPGSSAAALEEDLCPRISTDSGRLESVLEAARAGRLVMVLRHAQKGDPVERECEDPKSGLTVEGFSQAGQLRGHFQRLGWSFMPVLSSPYCRTLQTAETAHPGAEPVPTRGLVNCAIKELIVRHKPPGSNLLMSTHSNCLGEVLGVEVPHTDPQYDALAAFIDSANPSQPLGCALFSDWQDIKGE